MNGKEFYNNYSASIMLTFLIFANLTTFISISFILTGWKLNLDDSKIYILLLMIIVAIVNYKYFTYKNRFVKIMERYEATNNASGRISLVVGFLVFGSLGLLFLTMFIGLQFR